MSLTFHGRGRPDFRTEMSRGVIVSDRDRLVFDGLAPEVRQFVTESWAEFRRSERRGVSGIAGRRRQYGRRKPFDRAALLDSAARCLDMAEGSDLYDGNAYMIGALRNRRNYLIGRDGFAVEPVPAPGRTPDPGDMAAVRVFVEDFCELNDFPGLTRQTLYRLDTEGNSLQRLFFPKGYSVPTVRHVELSMLVPNHEGADGWGVVRPDDNDRGVESYWVRYSDEEEPESVPEAELLHVKDDDNGSLPFGWPIFEPALEPLLQADELGGAGRARVRVQCKWAFLEKVPGLTKAGQDRYLNSLTTRKVEDSSGTFQDVPTDARTPGYGLIRQTSAAELQPLSLGGGASDVLSTKSDALTEAAQAVGLATWMFTGEVDEKYANAFAAMGPTLETMVYTQGLLVDALVTGRIGTRASLIWRAIKMGVAAGILRREVLDTIRLKCTPRQLQTRDRAGELNTDTVLYDRGLMSADTMQTRGGLDPAEEKRKGAKPITPGQPAEPDPQNPAGPGVSLLGTALESWAVESRAWWADVDPPARALSPVRAEQWVAEGRDLSKLQKRLVTDRNGHRRVVYVRPGGKEKGKGRQKGESDDDPEGGEISARKSDDPDTVRKESAAAVRAVLANPAKRPEDVAGLADHLANLTGEQIRQLKADHKVRGGKVKADLISRVIDRANDPEAHKPPEPKPKEPRLKLLSSEITSRGGINPKDAGFLKFFSGVKEARENNWPLRMFNGKSTNGFDTLAESLQKEGYINPPEGVAADEYLAEKLSQRAEHDLKDITNDYGAANREYDAARQAAMQEGMTAEEIEAEYKKWEDEAGKLTAAEIYGEPLGDAAETGGDTDFGFGGDSAGPAVTVSDFDPGVKSRLPGVLAKVFGRAATERDVAPLVGAVGGGDTVKVSQASEQPDGTQYLSVTVQTADGVRANRGVYAKGREKWIVNDTSSAAEPGTGAGTRVFSEQVRAAAAAGFDRIEASGDRGPGKNGYYTLARWGYDGKLPAGVKRKLPAEFAKAKRVSDLMETPAGRDWWKANGDSVSLSFDLSAGSRSRATLDAYLAERAGR